MTYYVILCHIISSCGIPSTISNIFYIIQIPTIDISRLSKNLGTESLTMAISRRAFDPKEMFNFSAYFGLLLNSVKYNLILPKIVI